MEDRSTFSCDSRIKGGHVSIYAYWKLGASYREHEHHADMETHICYLNNYNTSEK